MKEIWKDIKGFKGLYQISNLGNVKSLDRDIIDKNGKIRHYKGQIMSGRIKKGTNQGYIMYDLFKDNKRKTVRVHRLVAEAFISNPNNLPEVNHIDGNKENNIVVNLEWCTRGENIKHAYNKNLRSPAMKGCIERNKKVSIKVALCDKNYNIEKEFNSISDLAKEINFRSASLSKQLRNKNGKIFYKNYYIKYI